MLTEATTPVDAAPRSVMWTISAVAERDGVSKQAVSKKVKHLAANHGLTVERNARGHVVRVNVAELDHLRGRFGDPSKDQRPAPAAPGSNDGPAPRLGESLDEARRVGAWLDNEQRRIALAKERKELVRAAGIEDALIEAGTDIARIVDRGVKACDELAAAVARDGAHGLRVAMKRLLNQMRNEIADALAKVANEAPALEPTEGEKVEAVAAAPESVPA